MDDLTVPVTRLPQRVLADAPLSESSVQRVLVELLQSQLYTELPIEELLAVDEPEPDRSVRRRGPARALTRFDLCPRYELWYAKGMTFSEGGMIGMTTENKFRELAKWMFDRELESIAKEQSKGKWKLVAALVHQQDFGIAVPVRGTGPDMAAQIRASGGAARSINISSEAPGAGGQIIGYQHQPAIRWVIPMVFCDIARADLVDPARMYGTRDNPTSGLTEYIATRQFRHMSPGMTRNRELAESVVKEFESRRGEMAIAAARSIPLTREQVELAEAMQADGIPLARIAQLVNVSVPLLELAFAELKKN